MFWFFTFLSCAIYVLFVLVTLGNESTIKVNGRIIDNAGARIALAILAWPAMALAFSLLGFIGKFMLLPFTAWF